MCSEGTGLLPSMDLCHKIYYLVPSFAAPGEREGAFTVWLLTSSHDVVKALMSEKLLSLNHEAGPGADFIARAEEALGGLRFHVYAGVQRPNEAVVVPPGSVYLSATFGGRCSQVVWDIHTPFSLERSVTKLLPCTRLIKQLEHHKIKAMAYYTLSNVLKYIESCREFSMDATFASDFWSLVHSVTHIVLEEGVAAGDHPYPPPSRPPASRVCCFCGCNIFNRGFECPACNADVCVQCVAEGMGCGNASHFAELVLRECIPARELCEKIAAAKRYYAQAKGFGRQLPSDTLPEGQRSPLFIAQLQILRVKERVNNQLIYI